MKYLLFLLCLYPALLAANPLPGITTTEAVNEQAQTLAQPLPEESRTDVSSSWQKITLWIIQKQREYHRSISAKVETLSEHQSWQNVWLLLLLSFLYGVFHAAGPGHGKAVLTTYLLTQPEKLRQGVQLSFLAAMLQGLTAIILVSFLVHGLGWLAKEALSSVVYIEAASFVLVALLGLLLVIRGLRQLITTKKAAQFTPLHQPLALQISSSSLGSSACNSCGQVHHVSPEQLAGRSKLQSLGLVFSIGMRPCSGAVLVLVATNLLGLWWIGIMATLTMALGTAITVASLAIVAVQARLFAKKLLKVQSQGLSKLSGLLALVGGGLILLLGTSLFISSITSSNSLGLF